MIAKVLKSLPQPFDRIKGKDIENWETRQLALAVSPDPNDLTEARAVIADNIKRQRETDRLDSRSDDELLEMAKLYAARLISPAYGKILVDGDPFFEEKS
jgi:hypothetical protein